MALLGAANEADEQQENERAEQGRDDVAAERLRVEAEGRREETGDAGAEMPITILPMSPKP